MISLNGAKLTVLSGPTLEQRKQKHLDWLLAKHPHLVELPEPKRKKLSCWARRKQREAQCGPGWTPEEWANLLARYSGKCLRCGSTERIVPDHVRPMKRGGEHHISNIQPLCNSCNIWKGLKVIDFRTLIP